MSITTILKLKCPLEEASLQKEESFVNLFSFAAARGAALDGIRVGRDKYGGRGLFATRGIPAGGVVATLPRDLRIGQQQACARLALPSNTPDLSALALYIISYLETGGVADDTYDDWGAYIRSLPRGSEFTNGVLMTDDEVKEWSLRGKEYEKAITQIRKTSMCCAAYISDLLCAGEAIPEDSALKWAVGMILSRSHAFGSKSRYLTPVFDLANHLPQSKGGGKLVSDDQGRLVLRAGHALKCGDEVTFDYECEDDAQLVATYGFSLQPC